MRALRPLLFGLLLLWAQQALLAHGIEHAMHDPTEDCRECLVLPGFTPVPAAKLQLPCTATAPLAREAAVPPAPSFAQRLAFHSRAPPATPSC